MPTNTNEYNREYYAKNRDVMRAKQRAYDRTDERKQARRVYRKSPSGRKSAIICQWRQHGINCDEEWEDLWNWYDSTSCCQICDKKFELTKDKNLDHDHNIDGYNVRSILCTRCNHSCNEI